MTSSAPRCTGCDIALPPGADRCPQCLRKSTVEDPADPRRRPAGSIEDEGPPSHAALRFVLGAGTAAAGAVASYFLIGQEQWLRAHSLWLAAIAAAMGLVTLPVRAAFSPRDRRMTSAEALRYYALAIAAAVGTSLGLAAVLAVVGLFVGDAIWAIFVGLLVFLVIILSAPVLIGALRRREPIGRTVRALGKNTAIAVGIVAAVAAIVGLRVLRSDAPGPRPLVIPENHKALLDPLDLESLAVQKRSVRDAQGLSTLWLQADGGDVKRTLAKLSLEALLSLDGVRKDPEANGEIVCWVPKRLRTQAGEREVRAEQERVGAAIEANHVKTPNGRSVRVRFEFGEPP